MSKKSAIKRHVQTSIVARIVYRLVCLALIAAGVFGLFLTFSASDHYYDYTHRNKTITATVTDLTKETDEYGYDTCTVSYKFNLDGTTYTSTGLIPNNYSCGARVNDQITVRYQADRPVNNAYGDNKQDESMRLFMVIALAVISVIPLGVGFVGLVAIHKAMRAEDELEEAREARARKRAYRRKLKQEKSDRTDQTE